MITVFGETVCTLSEREDGLYEKSFGGRGYDTALALAEDGDFPLLLTGIGQDAIGGNIVENLVEKEILFDSDMALMNIQSPVRIQNQNGRVLDLVRNSSAMSVQGELLNLALSMHSDITCVMLSNPTLSYNPVSFTYLDGASFLSPYPYIYLDAVEFVSNSVWERMRTEASAIADIVRVREEDRTKIENYKDVLLVTGKDKVSLLRNGSALASIETDKCYETAAFGAHFMKSLEKKGLLEEKKRDGITDEALVEALKFAVGRLS